MESFQSRTIGERDWLLLIDAIKSGRVVPILGENVFSIIDSDNNSVPFREFVLSELSRRFLPHGESAEDISEIEEGIEEYNYLNRRVSSPTNIYFEINQILKNVNIKCEDGVLEMVKSCRFPLILSTAYLPGIDTILGIDPGCVGIYKKSASQDIDTYLLSETNPSLYYLFGKASNIPRTFMATEDDFLDYLHSWHNVETRPKNLSRYLSDKYLLVLGSEYPDWLFRFFWHSIRNFNILPSRIEEIQGLVTLDNSAEDKHLRRFISHVQAQAYSNTSKFVSELNERWMQSAGVATQETESGSEIQSGEIDVFISYASEDILAAEKVADIFREKGASVWFDKRELKGGDEYDRLILKEIAHCKRFVPILSHTSFKEERRYFRKEWSMALDELPYRLHMDFIIPIQIVDDLDRESDLLPNEFKSRHFENINDVDFEDKVKFHVRKLRG